MNNVGSTKALPPGWEWLEIGDFGQWRGGGTPSKKNPSFWNGNILWVSPKDMKSTVIHETMDKITDDAVENSSTHLVPPNSLLMVTRSGILAHTFPVAVNATEVTINQDLKTLTPFANISPMFLMHWLKATEGTVLSELTKAGTTVASVDFPKFKAHKLPVPPLDEQRRIADKIDTLQAKSRRAHEALETVRPLLEKFRQSVLAAAFRGDLTAEWRKHNPDVEPAEKLLERIRTERRTRWEEAELAKMRAKGKEPKNDKWKAKYKEPEPVDVNDLPELPEGWCWTNVETISTKVSDGVHKKPNYVESGIPFLKVKDLTCGPGISFENTSFVTLEDHNDFCKRTNPERGDVLITKDGTLGVVRVIDTDIEFSIFVSLALIKPVIDGLSQCVGGFLSSPLGQKGMKVTGTGLQHIHLKDLRATVLPLPPLEEQVIISEVLEGLTTKLDDTVANVAKQLEQVNTLDQSILAKAFRGELVPQDPNDEPASVLLERIKAEREATKGKKQTRRKG